MDEKEIERKDFTISLRGYDREEVDAYLSELAQEIRQLRMEAGKPAPVAPPAATSPAETYRQIGEETSRILVAADDAAREIKGRAEREAASVVADARTKAEELSRRTQRELKEAEQSIRSLSEARDTLATQLEDVGRRLQETTARLRTPMEGVPAPQQARSGAATRETTLPRETPRPTPQREAPRPAPSREAPSPRPAPETERPRPGAQPPPEPRATTRTPPRPTPIPPRETPSARAETKPAREPTRIPPREAEERKPRDEIVPEPPTPRAETKAATAPEAKVTEAPPAKRQEPAAAPPQPKPTPPPAPAPPPAPKAEAPPAPIEAGPAPETRPAPEAEMKAPSGSAVTASATAALEQLLEEVRRDREQGQREVQAVLGTLTEEKEAEAAPRAAPVTSEDAEDILRKREDAIGAAPSTAARRLKRLLQEDQNYLLDRLRTHKGKGSFDESIAPSDVQLERFQEGMTDVLKESFVAGRHLGGAPEAGDASRPVADLVSKQIVAPLRRDLSRIVDSGLAAGDTVKAIAERVSDVFRVWKGIRTELLGEGLVYAAYHQGLVDALKQRSVSTKRWVRSPAEHDCPRGICDTNTEAGAIALGSSFPSGHLTPPAHGGCTCALAEG